MSAQAQGQAQANAGIKTLTSDQSLAMEKMLHFATMSHDRIFTLSGFAGVGKTTVMADFAREASKSFPVALTAPTNKAVKVLDDMRRDIGLDRVQCRTIYSLLGLKLGRDKEIKAVNFSKAYTKEPFTRGVIVIDEASMVGKDLFDYLGTVLKQHKNVKLLFVGDPLQLPPINEGEAMPFTNAQDSFQLDKIVRQAEENPIIRLTVEIRKCIENGEVPSILTDATDAKDGVFTLGRMDFMSWLEHSFKTKEYQTNPMEFRAIAWRNNTVDWYNMFIRKALYGDTVAKQKYILGERVTAVSPIMDPEIDKNVTMRTDDEATVTKIEKVRHPVHVGQECYAISMMDDFAKEVTAYATTEGDCYDWFCRNMVTKRDAAKASGRFWPDYYSFVEAFADIRILGSRVDTSNIRPAHTITAHKSQGSTFNRVFVDAVDILANNNRVEALKCLYVAVSRARRAVAVKTRE